MSIKLIRVKIDDRPYVASRDPSVEGMTRSGGRFDKLLRRLIIYEADNPEEAVGCIVFFLGILASYSWDSKGKTDYGKEEKSEFAFANLLPHIPLDIKHLKKAYGRRLACLIFTFGKDKNGYKEDKIDYSIQLKDGFLKTAQRIVFPKGLNKKDVQREILQILVNSLEENPGTFMLFEDLQASIPLITKSLIFHLNLLEEDRKIKFTTAPHSSPPKIISVKIMSKGIKTLEGETEIEIQSPQVVKQVFGTNIENLTTHGDNSPINITVGDIDTAFGDITKQIKEKKLEDKEKILELTKKLQDELSGKKDPKKVKVLMGMIKEKATWVYNLIIKNPILTAYLTQLLLRTL